MCPAVLPPGIVPQKQKNIEDMKATYQKPEIMTERVETQQSLLAGSNLLDIANNRVELNYETMEDGSGSDAASKGNSFDLWEE